MPSPDLNIPDDYKIRIKEMPTTFTVNTPDLDDININKVGIPTDYNFKVDAGLDDIRVKEIPRIEVDTNIRIKELPETRTHVPMHFNFGVKLFGLEFLVFSLCGELQSITEKYIPNKWERCEGPAHNS